MQSLEKNKYEINSQTLQENINIYFNINGDILRREIQKNSLAVEKEKDNVKKTHHERVIIEKQKGPEIVLDYSNFLKTIQDIYYDYDYYKNKNIILQGLVTKYISSDEKIRAFFVYRNGPGCCEDDKWSGFLLNDTLGIELKQNDWVKVIGKPIIVLENNNAYLFLEVSNITVLPDDQRKQEIVYWEAEH